MADRYRCIILVGAPGSGKGTQGKLLGQQDGFIHLATGDIFRSLDKASERGQQFVEYSSRGELVPDDLTIEIWREHVREMICTGAFDPEAEILLLDGMPRSLNQATMLDGLIDPLAILHLAVGDINAMVQRMKLRAEKEGRHDDADECVIRNRFDVYDRETAPVLGHYDANLIVEIDAVGTIEEVFERTRAAIGAVREARLSKG